MQGDEQHPVGASQEPTFGQWLWFAAIITVIGYAVIVATVFMNTSTLFDYNGKQSGPQELSLLESFLIVEFLVVATVTGIFLRKAFVVSRPRDFRWWHLLPTAVAASSVFFAFFALGFGSLEIIN